MVDNIWENGMKENKMEKAFMFLKMVLKKKEYGKMEKESNGYQMTKNSDIYLLTKIFIHTLAYIFVNSAAFFKASISFDFQWLAASLFKGSSGFGELNKVCIDKRTALHFYFILLYL